MGTILGNSNNHYHWIEALQILEKFTKIRNQEWKEPSDRTNSNKNVRTNQS